MTGTGEQEAGSPVANPRVVDTRRAGTVGTAAWRRLAGTAVAGLLLVGGAACGSPARPNGFSGPDGRPSARAVAGAEQLTWRLRAATALGTMDAFFDSMGASLGTGTAEHDVIVKMCATAVPRLPDLAVSVAGGTSDRALELPVREAVSGFGQYVRSCAAGDDAGATQGFHFYDEGHQAAIRLITPRTGGMVLTG